MSARKELAKGIAQVVKGTRGSAVKASGPTKAENIMKLVDKGNKDKAIAEYGKQAVAQAVRRATAKAEKEKAKKIAERPKVQSMSSFKRNKMSKQEKATAAYKRIEKANSKAAIVNSVDDFIKAGGKIQTVPANKAKVYREEMEAELKGQTARSRRERIKQATDKKKQRKARKLTQGRESDEAFESRMSREARAGGVEDVGRKRSQRGSAPDPMYDYERGQAADFLRGKDKPFMDEYERMMSFKKGGKISKPKGCGAATRGYGKAMKGGK
jgi:hypothetical protein